MQEQVSNIGRFTAIKREDLTSGVSPPSSVKI